MKTIFPALFAAAAIAGPALSESHASGDIEAGEKAFKRCKACHAIVADNGEGEVIFKGGKTGPNLWGLPGRSAGAYPDYNYGPSLAKAGEVGLVWDEASFTAYTQDPKKYLVEYLDDGKAKSKMSFKLRKGAEDVWAYIVSVSPEPGTAEEAETTDDDSSSTTATE